jgi:hypothetical protein
MKTSNQDRNDNLSDGNPSNENSAWANFKEKIDARPSRTATIMAFILVLVFAISMVRTYKSFTKPADYTGNAPSQRLIEQIHQNYIDSVGFSGRINTYFILLEIQKELLEMQNDSTKMDSVRIEQLLNILNMN